MKMKKILIYINVSLIALFAITFVSPIVINIVSDISYDITPMNYIGSILIFLIIIVNILFIPLLRKERKKELEDNKKEFIFNIKAYKELNPIALAMYNISTDADLEFKRLNDLYKFKINYYIKEQTQKLSLSINLKLGFDRTLNIVLKYDDAFTVLINNNIVDEQFDNYEVLISYLINIINMHDKQIQDYGDKIKERRKIEFIISLIGYILLPVSWIIFVILITFIFIATIVFFFLIILVSDFSYIGDFILIYSIYIFPIVAVSIIISTISLIISAIRKNKTAKNVSTYSLVIGIIEAVCLISLMTYITYAIYM